MSSIAIIYYMHSYSSVGYKVGYFPQKKYKVGYCISTFSIPLYLFLHTQGRNSAKHVYLLHLPRSDLFQ